MHEEGDHATKNQLSGSRLQGDGLEKRLEQWECILHDQHGRLLPQRLANGPLCHHHFAQFRRKEGTPPPTHVAKKRNFKTYLLGIELMPRIRNWKGMKLFRPSKTSRYRHIDSLFTDVIDWPLIETHLPDMLRVVLSIRAGRISASTLLRKL